MTAVAELAARLAAAKPGDRVATGPGVFDLPLALRGRDYGGVVLDATGAHFRAGAVLNGIRGLTISSGRWGRGDADLAAFHTIAATGCTDVSLAEAEVIGNGDGRGSGISLAVSARVTVRDCRFHGHATAIGVRSCHDALVTRNRITGSTADGINITDCQRAVASVNEMREFVPGVGAHPDGIQLRDLAGKPRQADVWLLNNLVEGRTQGLFGHAFRTVFAGNYVSVEHFTHTITGSGALECEVVDNVLANRPGSLNGPGRLKGFEDGSNRVAGNRLLDLRGAAAMPVRLWSFRAPPWAVGSAMDDRNIGPREAVEAMP